MKDIKTFLIGFLTCACLFLIMGQTNKNFGDIIVDSIAIENEENKLVAYFGRDESGYGKILASTGNIENAVILSPGRVDTYDAAKNLTARLGTTQSGGGALITMNSEEQITSSIGTSTGGHGVIKISDEEGEITFSWPK